MTTAAGDASRAGRTPRVTGNIVDVSGSVPFKAVNRSGSGGGSQATMVDVGDSAAGSQSRLDMGRKLNGVLSAVSRDNANETLLTGSITVRLIMGKNGVPKLVGVQESDLEVVKYDDSGHPVPAENQALVNRFTEHAMSAVAAFDFTDEDLPEGTEIQVPLNVNPSSRGDSSVDINGVTILRHNNVKSEGPTPRATGGLII